MTGISGSHLLHHLPPHLYTSASFTLYPSVTTSLIYNFHPVTLYCRNINPHVSEPRRSMDQHDDFDSVSWKQDPDSDLSRPTTSGTDADFLPETDHDVNGKRRMSSGHEEPQVAALANAVDMASIADGVLECRVDSPLKENDGTKDAYISYLVTTHVSACPSMMYSPIQLPVLTSETDRLQVVPETRLRDTQTLHRFLLLV